MAVFHIVTALQSYRVALYSLGHGGVTLACVLCCLAIRKSAGCATGLRVRLCVHVYVHVCACVCVCDAVHCSFFGESFRIFDS